MAIPVVCDNDTTSVQMISWRQTDSKPLLKQRTDGYEFTSWKSTLASKRQYNMRLDKSEICDICFWYDFVTKDVHPGPRLNIKTVLFTYGDFHVKDKTAVRTSYL